jgi:hypothetical protein
MVAKRPNTATGSARNRQRSAFRSEFYADRNPHKKDSGASRRNDGSGSGRRRRRVSVWVPVFGLTFLFCVIAVAGSSAMIWLRKLGALFGVHWSGDL